MPRTSDSNRPAPNEKPAIVFNDVCKSFKIKHTHSFKEAFISLLKRKELSSQFNAIKNLTFEVPEGQSIALMGRNGSGKSTTLKMLSGVMQPDSGWIRTRGRVAGLLEVGAGFHPNLTGRDNVYLNAAILGMSKEETDERFEQILEFSEIGDFIDTEVKRYSSGMYSRLGFSVAVHTELDVLLVDEILSVGDAQFREKCNEKMLELQEQGKTMFIVSHNANQVKKLCERGIVLEQGAMNFDGPIDEAVDFLRSPPGPIPQDAPKPEVPIVGEIKKAYDRYPPKYGTAIAPEAKITANGGGVMQEFEKGIITYCPSLPQDQKAYGLTKGRFLAEYRKVGGPSGPWGFLAGKPQGDLEEGEPRTLQLQNGEARYTHDSGVYFLASSDDDQ